jgi:CRP-like cAMP-binding protein
MNVNDAIKASYIAQGLTDEEVGLVASIAEQVTFADNEMILKEFSEAHNLYILLEGKARVETSMGDLIARLGPGAILGELALFDRGERSACVASDGESNVARISADRFNDLLDLHPALGLKVLRHVGMVLCQRLRSSNVQLETVLTNLTF